MDRARLIVKEVKIQKQGEINFFQVRLPQDTKRIIGIETDAIIISPFTLASSHGSEPNPDGTVAGQIINRTPFLKWDTTVNPTLGKLKLQSQDRAGIFFETWIYFIQLGGGIPDMSFGMFPKSPYSLNQNSPPKKVNLTCKHSSIEGMYEDEFGKTQNRDMNYILKVFVWIETTEESKGVVFDFQENDTSGNEAEGNLLELKT